LLTYSRARPDESKVTDVDLKDVLKEVLRNLSHPIEEKNAIVDVSQLPVVKGIGFQLHQVFTNLISNALKFSKIDTPPRISVRLVDSTNETERNMHHIVVEDNGIGFEEEYKSKIFELFQRLHGRSEYPGTGIGLSIVKKIIENHQGNVYADSIPGVGSQFHVLLPST
jgi:signal transduction histidine kinase